MIKGVRYSLLKDPTKQATSQLLKLAEVQQTNKRMFRAALLYGELRYVYKVPKHQAAERLDAWLAWASRSRLKPFIKLARTIRKHKQACCSGRDRNQQRRLEALNSKARLISHRAYGFHSAEALIAMIYLSAPASKSRSLTDKSPPTREESHFRVRRIDRERRLEINVRRPAGGIQARPDMRQARRRGDRAKRPHPHPELAEAPAAKTRRAAATNAAAAEKAIRSLAPRTSGFSIRNATLIIETSHGHSCTHHRVASPSSSLPARFRSSHACRTQVNGTRLARDGGIPGDRSSSLDDTAAPEQRQKPSRRSRPVLLPNRKAEASTSENIPSLK